jgi:hypothetical protein
MVTLSARQAAGVRSLGKTIRDHRGRPGLNGKGWRLSLQSSWGIVKRPRSV